VGKGGINKADQGIRSNKKAWKGVLIWLSPLSLITLGKASKSRGLMVEVDGACQVFYFSQ
jgi:hypothetical protein